MAGDEERVDLAEDVESSTSAVLDGDVVGEIDGLVWNDVSGVDIVCVTLDGDQVAVPVDHDEWRFGEYVELHVTVEELHAAPGLSSLIDLNAESAVDHVAQSFNLGLAGPPPGPGTGSVPPWWDQGAAGAADVS